MLRTGQISDAEPELVAMCVRSFLGTYLIAKAASTLEACSQVKSSLATSKSRLVLVN